MKTKWFMLKLLKSHRFQEIYYVFRILVCLSSSVLEHVITVAMLNIPNSKTSLLQEQCKIKLKRANLEY